MLNTIKNYAAAIASGNIADVAATLSTTIKVLPPAVNQPNEGKEKSAMMLSAVAAVVDGFKAVRTYAAGDNWYTVLLEGTLEGTPVQFIDQVHVDENNLVDHVDIFLRPATLIEVLLGKVGTEVKKRTASKV